MTDPRSHPNYFNGHYNNDRYHNVQANIGGNNIHESLFVNRQIPNPNYNPSMPVGRTFIGASDMPIGQPLPEIRSFISPLPPSRSYSLPPAPDYSIHQPSSLSNPPNYSFTDTYYRRL